MNLKCFTQPEILQQIGSPRLEKLFNAFRDDPATEHLVLPTPESLNGSYFDSLAATLGTDAKIPDRLRNTLLALETAASSENSPLLDAAIQRRIPNVAVSQTCALDRALELWFHAPEEFAIFAPSSPLPAPSSVPLSASQNLSVSEFSENCPPQNRNTEAPAVLPSSFSPLPSPVVLHSSFSILPSVGPVDGCALLQKLSDLLKRWVILPQWAPEAIALWILHTYAFHLRDITAYIGIESPEKRCGKTTLLTLLNELAHRAIASSNISPPAFFRVIEDLSPTLLIDEVDTFLTGNDQLRGILNAGCYRKTGFVLRAAPSSGSDADTETEGTAMGAIKRYSCWCPKALAKIGRFPDTLADRCIIIRMQRKTSAEKCDRSRDLDAVPLKQQCLRFVADHASEIATAKPQLPSELNDRAADIWEPLLVLADLAGGDWPKLARQAAIGLSANAQESSPIGSLLLDIFFLFTIDKVDRIFTHTLVAGLNTLGSRPWKEPLKGKEATDLWLAQQLRPYGIKSRTTRIGEQRAKGYLEADFLDVFRRYIPRSEVDAFLAEHKTEPGEAVPPSPPPPTTKPPGPQLNP